jgi:hypothetical protein
MNAPFRQFEETASPLAPAAAALIAGQLEAELAVLGQMETHCRQLLVERAGAVAPGPDPASARETLDAIDLQRQRLEHQRQETLAILQPLTVGPVRLSRLIARADSASQVRLGQLRAAVLDKMVRIRSMTLASQMALVYRLDHYRQLLAALGGAEQEPATYLPGGRPAPSRPTPLQDC